MLKYDVVISGAGPAGCTCALALESSGLKVALLDKATFPRDKICGDFIAAKGFRELASVKPDLVEKLKRFPKKAVNNSMHFYINNYKPIQFNWVLTSYTIKREDFDNELLKSVLDGGKIDFYPNHRVKKVTSSAQAVVIETKDQVFEAKMVIGADGAHSQVAKDLANYKVDKNHYGGSVRAYFSGVENIKEETNEFYFHKNVIPGYFWLFPVSPTEANVGIGMHSSHITKDKINLKERFYEFIEQSPKLKSKLGNAKMEGKLEGFGLPFFSKKYTISGNRFLLLGDAASLMDPSNGEGIMPAIASGKMAGQHILKAFENNRFDADFNKAYEKAIHKRYWKEMKMKARFVNTFADKHRLINMIGYLSEKSPFLTRLIQKFM